jgi:hypothetical protein
MNLSKALASRAGSTPKMLSTNEGVRVWESVGEAQAASKRASRRIPSASICSAPVILRARDLKSSLHVEK